MIILVTIDRLKKTTIAAKTKLPWQCIGNICYNEKVITSVAKFTSTELNIFGYCVVIFYILWIDLTELTLLGVLRSLVTVIRSK